MKSSWSRTVDQKAFIIPATIFITTIPVLITDASVCQKNDVLGMSINKNFQAHQKICMDISHTRHALVVIMSYLITLVTFITFGCPS